MACPPGPVLHKILLITMATAQHLGVVGPSTTAFFLVSGLFDEL